MVGVEEALEVDVVALLVLSLVVLSVVALVPLAKVDNICQ